MIRALALVAVAVAATAGDHQTTFRVQAELVRIDVLVRHGGTPVVGLTANDFVVEDNGVPQRVSLLRDSGGVTVSTVLDVSGSMTPQKLDNAAAGVRAVMAALNATDRHALYAFAGEIRQIAVPPSRDAMPMKAIAQSLRQAGGMHTSLIDALFTAIVPTTRDSGPRMVAVLTDGRDNTSWLSAESVIDAAIRHETVVYPVAVAGDARYPFGVPPMAGDDGLRLLQAIADRTGGRVIHAEWSRDLAPVFDALMREYRQRYILSFTPERVPKGDGWHRLTVRLRNRAGKVHARDGYWSR